MPNWQSYLTNGEKKAVEVCGSIQGGGSQNHQLGVRIARRLSKERQGIGNEFQPRWLVKNAPKKAGRKGTGDHVTIPTVWINSL